MLFVLVLDAAGYLIAVTMSQEKKSGLIVALEDIFVVVALLTISVGLILPGTIAQSAIEVSKAALATRFVAPGESVRGRRESE